MRDMRPSMTAQSVAANILKLSYDETYGHLVPAEAVEPTRWFLQASSGWLGDLSVLLHNPLVRGLAQAVEQVSFPGISLHNAIRKRWIEAEVREGLARGAAQVVILGAGFDTLAYRLHREHPRVLWLEIDHPATLHVKQRALAEHAPDLGDNLRLRANDFSEKSLAELLKGEPDFHFRRTTLFIAEGLLMYLAEPEVRQLLRTLSSHSGPGSRLLGTILEENPHNRSSKANLKLQIIGEPYQWRIAPAALADFLRQNGLRLLVVQSDQAVLPQFLAADVSRPQLPGEEYFFCARCSP
jgi:methyltransferase (TIGR00027 family)